MKIAMKTKVFNIEGQEVGEVELKKEIFGQEVSHGAIYEAVRAIRANQRASHASTKDRDEVSGGSKKPWRQKGTGRARAGGTRLPHWRGGGVVFGPRTERNYKIRLNRKAKKKALYSLLSEKVSNGQIMVIDSLLFEEPKTSKMVEVLESLKVKKPLIILREKDRNITLSVRNIKGADIVLASNLNVYDLLNHKEIIILKDALSSFKEAA